MRATSASTVFTSNGPLFFGLLDTWDSCIVTAARGLALARRLANAKPQAAEEDQFSKLHDALFQFSWTMRQHLRPVRRDQHVVLDAHAEFVGKIDARLTRHDHAGFELHLHIRTKEGGLVNLQAEAVPQAVVEEFAVALVGNVAARDGVHVLARRAGP